MEKENSENTSTEEQFAKDPTPVTENEGQVLDLVFETIQPTQLDHPKPFKVKRHRGKFEQPQNLLPVLLAVR